MSEEPTPAPRGISPWWLLLLLPVAALAGWGIGRLPAPSSTEPVVQAPPSDAPAAALAPTRSTSEAPPPARASQTPEFEPAPRSAPAPPERRGSPEISQWTTLEGAVAESGRNGKPILLDFNADWCGPCQRMKQQVFDDFLHGRAVRTAVIPVSMVDRVREVGRNSEEVAHLQKQFQVDAFPTLVVLSPATGRFVKTKGYGGAEATVAWIERAANEVTAAPPAGAGPGQ